MLISAINTFSLIEYPGQIACIVFTPGCNMRCQFCHNSEFVLPEKLKTVKKNLVPEEAVFSFLQQRKGKLSGVSICGGEPTLQPGLLDFCKRVKKMGYLVKLDTNGSNPETIQTLITQKLVDYVAMDIKHEIGKFHEVVGLDIDEENYKKSIQILLASDIDYEFRTTVIDGVHDAQNIKNIAKHITGAKHYYLQNYKSGNTLNPYFEGMSFGEKDLESFKNISKQYIAHVGIRT